MKLTDFVKLVSPTAHGTVFRYWSASIGNAESRGSTSDEACSDLKKLIESAFEGHYSPTVLQVGRYMGIVWRTPHGWLFSLEATASPGKLHGVTLYGTMQEAIAAMRDQAACME